MFLGHYCHTSKTYKDCTYCVTCLLTSRQKTIAKLSLLPLDHRHQGPRLKTIGGSLQEIVLLFTIMTSQSTLPEFLRSRASSSTLNPNPTSTPNPNPDTDPPPAQNQERRMNMITLGKKLFHKQTWRHMFQLLQSPAHQHQTDPSILIPLEHWQILLPPNCP